MSKAKEREVRKYILEKARWLPTKMCEWPGTGCVREATEIHHARGRVGKMLNDKRYWWALCREHHRYLHDHGKQSRKLGLLR